MSLINTDLRDINKVFFQEISLIVLKDSNSKFFSGVTHGIAGVLVIAIMTCLQKCHDFKKTSPEPFFP